MRVRELAAWLVAAAMTLVLVVVLMWPRLSGDGTYQPRIDGYQVSADNELSFEFTTGLDDRIVLLEVVETSSQIKLIVRVEHAPGRKPDLGVPYKVTQLLREPLGSRSVVDASNLELNRLPS